MSRTTRRKHVLKEMIEDDFFELPKEHQKIVRVVSSRGNNLHEVEPAETDAENYLVSMPMKFRNNFWVKRGDCLLVEPIEEGNKVKGEICRILTAEHVKEYTKAGIWPKRFTKKRVHETADSDSMEEDDSGFVVRNLNRPQAQNVEETESEDETSTDEE